MCLKLNSLVFSEPDSEGDNNLKSRENVFLNENAPMNQTNKIQPIFDGENLRNHYDSSRYLNILEKFPENLKVVPSKSPVTADDNKCIDAIVPH